jgi:hypothetical protein
VTAPARRPPVIGAVELLTARIEDAGLFAPVFGAFAGAALAVIPVSGRACRPSSRSSARDTMRT